MKDQQMELTIEEQEELFKILRSRFEKNKHRHDGIEWSKVQTKLESAPEKVWSLSEMERTEGEPDVVGQDKKTGEYIFIDCSPESPKGRRSYCYDHQAWVSRKENKPQSSAMEVAETMGVTILNETEYRELQQLGNFDTKTSSWIITTPDIRKLGGALFCDRRYNTVFLYHNGADSYYAARGFRASLRV